MYLQSILFLVAQGAVRKCSSVTAFALPNVRRRASLSSCTSVAAVVRSDSESSTILNVFKVPYGEESRQYRRTSYVHEDWVKHRNDKRFFRNLALSVKSGLLRNIAKEVTFVTGIATFICAWNALMVTGYVDLNGVEHEAMETGYPLLSLPMTPFTLLSSSLGLLLGKLVKQVFRSHCVGSSCVANGNLPRESIRQSFSIRCHFVVLLAVFRTNASYKRWDEARKAWGLNINHSRNLMRQATAWSSAAYEPDVEVRRAKLRRLARAVWSFQRSLNRHLSDPRSEPQFVSDLNERLKPEEADAIIRAIHRPNRALLAISRAVNDLPMHFMRRNEIDKSIIIFEDTCGGCERLFSSPVPLFYTRHTARFLSAWLASLPLGLYGAFGGSWNHAEMIPATFVIAIFLFGIEELAVQLEEPFSILPMEGFCDKIGNNTMEIANWHGSEPVKTASGRPGGALEEMSSATLYKQTT